MAEAVDYKYIGTRPVRPDGVDKVTGRAQYGADPILPGMIHGRILRSPYAHAKIKSVNLSRALDMPGVFAAVSGADFPGGIGDEAIGGESGGSMTDLAKNVMARDKVVYHGQAVAAVAAQSPQLALQALKLIEVEYEELPVVLDVRDAMKDDAPLLDPTCKTAGVKPEPEKASNVVLSLIHI